MALGYPVSIIVVILYQRPVQICRALLMRDDALATRLIDRLFEAFDDEDIDWIAAKALGDICKTDMVLTKSNHAVIKVHFPSTTTPRY